jgi:uncharacterized SAM-binding protein YcdF (DUF218 family)
MTYTQPLVLLAVAIGAWGLYRRKLLLPWLTLAAVFLVCWPPAAWVAAQSLEGWYPRQALPTGDGQAIVVLSGGMSLERPERPYALAEHDTYARSVYAAWLYQHWRGRPVLACGGGDLRSPLAALMRQLLEKEGVPAASIWSEERSTSTYENALFGAEVLRAHGVSRIVLVTGASHMPRAERCFRKQGLAVVPAPCSFTILSRKFGTIFPNWTGLAVNENTFHEGVGLLAYWLQGRI